MLQASDYLTVASILAGFGVNVLMFRVQRELTVEDKQKELKIHREVWISWADYLIIATIKISLLLVVLPILVFKTQNAYLSALPSASCAAAVILVSAYPFAILAHYHMGIGGNTSNRQKGEPIEIFVVVLAFFIAILTWCMMVSCSCNSISNSPPECSHLTSTAQIIQNYSGSKKRTSVVVECCPQVRCCPNNGCANVLIKK